MNLIIRGGDVFQSLEIDQVVPQTAGFWNPTTTARDSIAFTLPSLGEIIENVQMKE